MAGQEKGLPDVDIFVGLDLYPDALSVFSWRPKKLEEIKASCLFVLDTNVLLLPYTTDSKSFSRIGDTYRALANDGRLAVPGQVAREFAKLRATKLAELRQQLADRMSRTVAPKSGSYPLLESTEEFQRVEELESKLRSSIEEYQAALHKVTDLIRSWEWADPVSVLYEGIFDEHVVFDPSVDREEVLKDLKRRLANKIPPGFKDGGKDDLGIGDLLIWKTILELGATRRQSVIFVSNDEKPDWWHRSGDATLLPRHELVEEFRRASGGESFHIMKLSDLLDAFDAEAGVVIEVRKRESEQVAMLSESIGSQLADFMFSDKGRMVERLFSERDREIMSRHQIEEERYITLKLMGRGWYLGGMHRHMDGVTIRLRDHTADYPGMKERHASGTDRLDALRNAYGEILTEERDDVSDG